MIRDIRVIMSDFIGRHFQVTSPPPSVWVATRLLILQREAEFLNYVRERLGDERVTVYLDDDAIIMAYGDDVLVSTEDEPLLFVGERHVLDLSKDLKP